MSIRIVPAQKADSATILEMIRGLAQYERLADQVVATQEAVERTLFGDHPAAEVLLAYVDEVCAGFALFFSTYSTFLAQPGIYLEDLFVKQEFRGQGIGFALLRELARLAAARKCGRVEWSVLNWNEPSIAFYKKLGAVPMEEWTMYRLTGDALWNLGAPSTE